MRYINKKIKGTTRGTFLGTQSFFEVWGDINPSKMQSFIELKLPDDGEFEEPSREVNILKNKLGIRLEPTDGLELDTNGPVSFIPRMMAAVCSIPKLMDHEKKRPVIALMSYDAIELADGQVPAPTERVEFFITIIRFNTERKATVFSATIIQLWATLRAARKARIADGLTDAKMTNAKVLTLEDKMVRRQSVSMMARETANESEDKDLQKESSETIEAQDASGYLEVHAFGLG